MEIDLRNQKEIKRLREEYIDGFCQEFNQGLLTTLESFDENCPHTKKWRENHFDYTFYTDFSLEYDDLCETLKCKLREGKNTNLTCEQVKKILRVNQMINKFDKTCDQLRFLNKKVTHVEMFKTREWKKISNQSHKILDLLRRN